MLLPKGPNTMKCVQPYPKPLPTTCVQHPIEPYRPTANHTKCKYSFRACSFGHSEAILCDYHTTMMVTSWATRNPYHLCTRTADPSSLYLHWNWYFAAARQRASRNAYYYNYGCSFSAWLYTLGIIIRRGLTELERFGQTLCMLKNGHGQLWNHIEMKKP